MKTFRWQYAAVAIMAVILSALGHTQALGMLPFMVAGVTATTDDLDELMKITFDDTLINETVTSTELLDMFPDGNVKTGPEGRWFELAHLVELPGSIGARSQGGFIPEPQPGKGKNGRVNLKKIMGAIEDTAEVLKKIRTDRAAFVNWAKEQFPLFKEGLVDELDRQLLGDGSGIRARVNAAMPDEVLVLDSTYGIADFDQTLAQFRKGMTIRAAENADGTNLRALAMRIEDVDWDAKAIIVNQLATALADNDYLAEGDAADNSFGKEIMGLLGLVDDGGIVETLQNIDRSDNMWFRSYVKDFQGAALTERGLLRVDREARFRGGAMADLLISSEEAVDEIWEDLKHDRAINDPRTYTAGRAGVNILFGGTRTVTLKTCRKMPSALFFGLTKSVFRKHVLHEWEWDDTTGSIWKQVITSEGRKDQFFAYGSMYMEMAIKSPQKCWRAEGFLITPDPIPES